MITRRRLLLSTIATAAVGAPWLFRLTPAEAGGKTFPVTRSEAEWRALLTSDQYNILRYGATELPHSSPLNEEKRPGLYHCAGCDTPLYSSAHKYDSGTGWPSFWQPLSDEVIGTTVDYIQGYATVEAHCARCGGHLGHIFGDGPEPTGLRHCINGDALVFRPTDAAGQG